MHLNILLPSSSVGNLEIQVSYSEITTSKVLQVRITNCQRGAVLADFNLFFLLLIKGQYGIQNNNRAFTCFGKQLRDEA